MTIPSDLKLRVAKEYLENRSTIADIAIKFNVSKSSVLRICNDYIIDGRRGSNFKGDYFKTSVKGVLGVPTTSINENYFEIIDTPSKAYWLGFIAADGCLSKDETKPRVSIGLSAKDIFHLEKFKADLQYSGKITVCNTLHTVTNKYYETCAICIWRPKLRNDIISHGVTPNKSKEAHLPNFSDTLMKHYIRGYFDGDGCWTIRNQTMMCCSFISSSESFILEAREYLSKACNLNNNIKITHYNNAYAFIYAGNLQCKRIYDYLYEDGGPWLDRKYEKSTEHFLKFNN